MRAARALSLFMLVAAAALSGCAAPAEEGEEGDATEQASGGESALSSGGDLVFEGQLRANDLPDKTLHLTFDDGPGTRTTELAELLATNGIKATFFINGVNVPGRQRAIDSIVGRGHTLANHTQSHLLLPTLALTQAISEIAATDPILVAAQPNVPRYFRAPFAGWNEPLMRALGTSAYAGYRAPIHWDIGTRTTATSAADWDCWSKKMSVERCGELYLAEIRAKGRGMVLAHDIHGRTVDMIRWMLPKLQAEGFRFTSIDQIPSVRTLAALPPAPLGPTECFSGSLVRPVREGACVQSTYDAKWYRCGGADWQKSSATDARCIERSPLR